MNIAVTIIENVFTSTMDHLQLMGLLKIIEDNELNTLVFFAILISYFVEKFYKDLLLLNSVQIHH